VISGSGGGGQGSCTPAGCWRGAEPCAVLLQTKGNSACCWEGRFAGKELLSDWLTVQPNTHPSFSTTERCSPVEIHCKSILGWILVGLLHSAFSLPNSATQHDYQCHLPHETYKFQMLPLFPWATCEARIRLQHQPYTKPTCQLLAG